MSATQCHGPVVYMATEGWTCRTCGKQLSCRRRLQTHEAHHTANRPFACSICWKWFRLMVDREQHELNHRHMCTVCGLMFTRQEKVKRHMKTMHGLLTGGPLPPKQQASTSDHVSFADDKRGSTPTGQGGDDVRCRQSPRSEHRVPQTKPKSRRHATPTGNRNERVEKL
jgi:hypothetical protein